MDEHKRSVKNCDCENIETAEHCLEADHNFSWDQKKVEKIKKKEDQRRSRRSKKKYIF